MMDWALLLLMVTFTAAMVQSTTGFGFGLISVPAFLIVMNSVVAIQLVIIITLCMSCVHWPILRGMAPAHLLKWLSLGCTLGFPLGIVVYAKFDLDTIKMTVALIIILLSVQNGRRLLSKETGRRQAGQQPHSPGTLMGVGAASGLMASSLAMPGPAVMLYLSRTGLDKNEIRATILTFFLFAYGGALLLQAAWIGIDTQTWINALVLTPAALVGVVVGNLLSKKINQQMFEGLVLLILLLTGFFMLVNL
jgi:uncharacterized membrane protein YfcA